MSEAELLESYTMNFIKTTKVTKMQKYRYIIADTFGGVIKGTNDEEQAVAISFCDEWYVVDTETCENIINGERTFVECFSV